MEWLHIVVITLIYVHEPKTVTWAKECEIPDYAYSEKRRKNQYGDEIASVDQDVERDKGNSLNDSKLFIINTKKKNENLKSNGESVKNCEDSPRVPRNLDGNFVNKVLQPPQSKSTYKMLLYQFQPLGLYTMEHPKQLYNIYHNKHNNEDDEPLEEIILPLVYHKKNSTGTQVVIPTDKAVRVQKTEIRKYQLTDKSAYIKEVVKTGGTRQLKDQIPGLPSSAKLLQVSEEIFVTNPSPLENKENNKLVGTTDRAEAKLLDNKVELTEKTTLGFNNISFNSMQPEDVQDIFKELTCFNHSKNISEINPEYVDAFYKTMVNQLLGTYNISDFNTTDRKQFKIDKTNSIYQNIIKDKMNSPPNLFNYFMTNDFLKNPTGNNVKVTKKLEQSKIPMKSLKNLLQMGNISTGRKDYLFPPSLLGNFKQNKQKFMFTSEHYPLEQPMKVNKYKSESKLNKENSETDDMNNQFAEEEQLQVGRLNSSDETINSNEEVQTPSPELTTKVAVKEANIIKSNATSLEHREKDKNPNWGYHLYTNHLRCSNDRLKEPDEYQDLSQEYPIENKTNACTEKNNYYNFSQTEETNKINKMSKKFKPFTIQDSFDEVDGENVKLQDNSTKPQNNPKRTINNLWLTEANLKNYKLENPIKDGFIGNDKNCEIKLIRIENNPIGTKKPQLNGIELQVINDIINPEIGTFAKKSGHKSRERNKMNLGQHESSWLRDVARQSNKRKREKKLDSFNSNAGNQKINLTAAQENNFKFDAMKELEEHQLDIINIKHNSKSDFLQNKKQINCYLLNNKMAPNTEQQRSSTPEISEFKFKNKLITERVVNVTKTKVKSEEDNKKKPFQKVFKMAYNVTPKIKINVTERSNLSDFKKVKKNKKCQRINNNWESNFGFRDKGARNVRMPYSQQDNQDFLKKWMELQRAYMSHLERESLPKFPGIKFSKKDGTSIPKFPIELEMSDDDSTEFPVKLKQTEVEKEDNQTTPENYFNRRALTNVRSLTANNALQPKATVNIYNQDKEKRDIHCCFKLNEGQQVSDQDRDREQLKQIDLKIENKKMKGCPLKETSIEMILTKNQLNQDDCNTRFNNQPNVDNIYSDEMQPFHIAVKNYTNNKSHVSKVQGMKDFNKLYSLTKVNKSRDKWDKQIKKLYEIINEEKKGEDRNKITFNSLYNILGKEQSRRVPKFKQVWNISTIKEKQPRNKTKAKIMDKQDDNVFPNEPDQKFMSDSAQQFLTDKTTPKTMTNSSMCNIFYNSDTESKETVIPLQDHFKLRFQNCVNKFREELLKDGDIDFVNNQSAPCPTSVEFNTVKSENNNKLKSTDSGVNMKTVKGAMPNHVESKYPDILRHNVYKFDSVNPKDKIKAKLLRKCENIKSNISYIMNLMTELQDEGKSNPESMNLCLQFTGFEDLLNNLRKFNRNPSFRTANKKDFHALNKLAMATKTSKNEDFEKSAKNKTFVNTTEERRGNIKALDTIGIKLTVPTAGKNQEVHTHANSPYTTFHRGFNITTTEKMSTTFINPNVSDIYLNTTSTFSDKARINLVTNRTSTINGTNRWPVIKKKKHDNLNEKLFNKAIIRKLANALNGKSNYSTGEKDKYYISDQCMDTHIGEVITDTIMDKVTCLSIDTLNGITSENPMDILTERSQYFTNDNLLEAISRKSIIKLVQNEISDKYRATSTLATLHRNISEAERREPTSESCLIDSKESITPANCSTFNFEKECNDKKSAMMKSSIRVNQSAPFDMYKFTKVINRMQNIPHTLSMPIIIDIMNSLMYNEDGSHMPEEKESSKEKRLKREDNSYNSQIPRDEDVETDLKLKKSKRKKMKKNKYSLNKVTRSKKKMTAEEDMSSKTVKKNKNERSLRNRIKPIYMPSSSGHTRVHILTPFLFGDNIVTISVTPCDEYYKNKKLFKNKYSYTNRRNSSNLKEVNGNDTSMVAETKYFVMSNIKGEMTEKSKTRQETQLKTPHKFFKIKEKIAIGKEDMDFLTEQNYSTTSTATSELSKMKEHNGQFLSQSSIETDENQETATTKKSVKITKAPLKLMNAETQEFPELEQTKVIEDLHIVNTSNDKLFDTVKRLTTFKSIKPTESYEKRKLPHNTEIINQETESRRETPEQMEFTITITLKPNVQNLRRPNENPTPSESTLPTVVGSKSVDKNNTTKSNHTEFEYDMDFNVTENQLNACAGLSEAFTQRHKLLETRAPIIVAETGIKQYVMSPPTGAVRNRLPNRQNIKKANRTLQAINSERNLSKYRQRTTQHISSQTLPSQELTSTRLAFNHQNYKLLKTINSLNLQKSLNLTKQNISHFKFPEKTEITIITEPYEDYLFHMELPQTIEGNNCSKDQNMTRKQETNQHDLVRNHGMEPTVSQSEVSERNEYNEDMTENQYDDDIESVIETSEEKPEPIALYQLAQSTETITECSIQTEAKENKIQDLVPRVPSAKGNASNRHEIPQNQYNKTYTQEILQACPQMNIPKPHPTERGNERVPMPSKDRIKGNKKQMLSNSEPQEQKDFLATSFTSTTARSSEVENHLDANSIIMEEEEEDECKDENAEEREDSKEHIISTKMPSGKYSTETLEDVLEEDEDDDDDEATDFQELLFWQNNTKKLRPRLKEPYIFPFELQQLDNNLNLIQHNTTRLHQEDKDIKSMKYELEQLKALLDNTHLIDKMHPSSKDTISTPKVRFTTNEVTTGEIARNYEYCENLAKDENNSLEIPDMVEIKNSNFSSDKLDPTEIKPILEARNNNNDRLEIMSIENLYNLTDRENERTNGNLSYLDGSNRTYVDTPSPDVLKTVNLNDLEESDLFDLEISPDIMEDTDNKNITQDNDNITSIDNSSETNIDSDDAAEMFGIINESNVNSQDPNNMETLNKSESEESKMMEEQILGDEIANQVELPPTNNQDNASNFDLLNLINVNNDSMIAEPTNRLKANYSEGKTEALLIETNLTDTDSKDDNSIDSESERNSEVILLDNASNDPADWVLHEEAMWNMDPWESFKQLENNDFKVPTKETFHKEKFLNNIVSKNEISVQNKELKDTSNTSANSACNQNSDYFRHNSNLFVKLNREPMQRRGHNRLDPNHRKCIKLPQYNKCHKNFCMGDSYTFLQPNLLSLKDKFSEESEKSLETQPGFCLTRSLETDSIKDNIKGLTEKNNICPKQTYIPRRWITKKHIYKKSKLPPKIKLNKQHGLDNNIVISTEIANMLTQTKHVNMLNSMISKIQNSTWKQTWGNTMTQTENNVYSNISQAHKANTTFQIESSKKPRSASKPVDKSDLDKEINELTTLNLPKETKLTTCFPCNQFDKVMRNSKNVNNLENLINEGDDHWDKFEDSQIRLEKLYDRNIIKKSNQNGRKNNAFDRGKGLINSSRKNLNFYKQRLNRKMTLLKNLQNKDNESKITPEEERKIKKILDGIISRYKGHNNNTEEECFMRFKNNKFGATKRNLTKYKNHRKNTKNFMKLERNRYRHKLNRHITDNMTESESQQRFISVGRNKQSLHLTCNKLPKKHSRVNEEFTGLVPITKTSSAIREHDTEVQTKNQQLHRDKKNYILGIPYFETVSNKNSTDLFSVIDSHMKILPCVNETASFNRGEVIGNIDENSPDMILYRENKCKLPYKISDGLEHLSMNDMVKKPAGAIEGILSLIYPDEVPTNTSQMINTYNGRGIAGCPMGSSVAGISNVGTFLNNQTSNQFEDLLKNLERDAINITDNNEKYKDMLMFIKDNQKDIVRNRNRETEDEIKARIKAINWLINYKNSQNLKGTQYKPEMLISKSESIPIGHSISKDKEDEIENMKKFITKYKTLLKMFEEQHSKIDPKDSMNQKLVKGFRDDMSVKDGSILIQRPTGVSNVWKKMKGREKNLIRMDELNKNVLDSNSKKKIHKVYMFGQNKQRKEDNPNDDSQDNEEPLIMKHMQDDDDDNLETCNDIEFETYDMHPLDKFKENDLGLNNVTHILANGTSMLLRENPPRLAAMQVPIMNKFKTFDKLKGYHNNQMPRIKLYKETEGGFKVNSSMNKLLKNQINPISCIGEMNYDKCKANWDNWTLDKGYPKQQPVTEEPALVPTTDHNQVDDKEIIVHTSDNNVLMLPIKFNTSDFIKLLNFKEINDTETVFQEDEPNHKTKLWDMNNKNSYVFDVDKGGPNGIKNRYYITFDSLSPNTVKVKNVSTIPVSNFTDFVSMANSGLNVVSIHKFMSPWEKNGTQNYINKNVKGNLKPEIRSIEKVCLWLRKPLSYNLTHQVPKVAISLGEVWPPMSEGQGPRNMKHYLVQVDPLVTPSKFPNQHIDYPSQISKVVWKAILHGFKTPKKTWQLTNQLG